MEVKKARFNVLIREGFSILCDLGYWHFQKGVLIQSWNDDSCLPLDVSLGNNR